MNTALGRRQGSVLKRVCYEFMQDEGNILCHLRIEQKVWSAVNSNVKAANLPFDEVKERNLVIRLYNLLVGIEHALKPVQKTVLNHRCGNRSVIFRQTELNDSLNNSEKISDTVV